MNSNGKELEDHIIRFFFDNIYEKDINHWKKLLDKLNEEGLLNLKNKFNDYLAELPSGKSEIKLYKTKSKIELRGVVQPKHVPNGDQGIISTSYSIGNEIIKLTEERLKLIQEERIKEFPKFGNWDNLDTPSQFKLNRNTLGCVALAFEKIKVSHALQLKNIYIRLTNILYQYDGKPYSYISFRNAKQKSKKTPKQCRKEVPFLVGESVEFVTYLLKMEEKFDSVKKNRHQS